MNKGKTSVCEFEQPALGIVGAATAGHWTERVKRAKEAAEVRCEAPYGTPKSPTGGGEATAGNAQIILFILFLLLRDDFFDYINGGGDHFGAELREQLIIHAMLVAFFGGNIAAQQVVTDVRTAFFFEAVHH